MSNKVFWSVGKLGDKALEHDEKIEKIQELTDLLQQKVNILEAAIGSALEVIAIQNKAIADIIKIYRKG